MSFRISKEISPSEVEAQLKQGQHLNLLDVREVHEWAEGHIEGAIHMPLTQLLGRLEELPANQEYIVLCHSGGRSGLACELMEEKGLQVMNMTGGISAWRGPLVAG